MKIICFGDSNTYGFDPRSYFGGRYSEDNRWVDILARKTGWNIVNMGQNGLSIPSTYVEAELYSNIFTSSGYDKIIIMLGSNDILQGLSADSVAGRMKRFLSSLNISMEKILLVSPPPMKSGLWVENARIIENSIHLGEKYLNLSTSLGINFLCTDQWDIELAYDGVHFTSAGHKAFADKLYDYLKR